MQLLDGRLAPITFSVGFLEASLARVGDTAYEWRKEHTRNIDVTPLAGTFEDALHRLEPLITPPRTELFLETGSVWTAYFDNGTRGPDPVPIVSYLCRRIGCRGVVVVNVPHTLHSETRGGRGTYGAVQFYLFGPGRTHFLNHVRAISATFDAGKWKFDAVGEVQPFEAVERYAARRITDRFTPAMLDENCRALGIRPFDDSFYTGTGILIALRDPLRSEGRTLSLTAARDELGIT